MKTKLLLVLTVFLLTLISVSANHLFSLYAPNSQESFNLNFNNENLNERFNFNNQFSDTFNRNFNRANSFNNQFTQNSLNALNLNRFQNYLQTFSSNGNEGFNINIGTGERRVKIHFGETGIMMKETITPIETGNIFRNNQYSSGFSNNYGSNDNLLQSNNAFTNNVNSGSLNEQINQNTQQSNVNSGSFSNNKVSFNKAFNSAVIFY